ncbi:hypothetical protein HRbin27_00754 [bacterium HR27]|nr:hypothetical protein HRbin27_00754 [bacterium HR27]
MDREAQGARERFTERDPDRLLPHLLSDTLVPRDERALVDPFARCAGEDVVHALVVAGLPGPDELLSRLASRTRRRPERLGRRWRGRRRTRPLATRFLQPILDGESDDTARDDQEDRETGEERAERTTASGTEGRIGHRSPPLPRDSHSSARSVPRPREGRQGRDSRCRSHAGTLVVLPRGIVQRGPRRGTRRAALVSGAEGARRSGRRDSRSHRCGCAGSTRRAREQPRVQ